MELLKSERKRALYNYLREKGLPVLTIKILLGYNPDGLDRLTILLGKGTDYDYMLIEDEKFREQELLRYIKESNIFEG